MTEQIMNSIVGPIINQALLALVGLMVAAAAYLLKLGADKMRLNLSAQRQAELVYHVRAAILEAEERVEAYAKVKAQEAIAQGLKLGADWLAEKAGLKLKTAAEALVARVPALAGQPTKVESLIKQELGAMPLGASSTGYGSNPFQG